MTEQTPAETTNLDRYGFPALPWSRPRDQLAARTPAPGVAFFLGTTRPDGRPHAAGIGPAWHDRHLYFTSGPDTQKAQNLAANPACTLSVRLTDIDLVLEGDAARVTDAPTLEALARMYRDRFTVHTAFGVATAEPYGATRWTFDR